MQNLHCRLRALRDVTSWAFWEMELLRAVNPVRKNKQWEVE
jgi:hypothetical protein